MSIESEPLGSPGHLQGAPLPDGLLHICGPFELFECSLAESPQCLHMLHKGPARVASHGACNTEVQKAQRNYLNLTLANSACLGQLLKVRRVERPAAE